jgi:hypothetical protein
MMKKIICIMVLLGFISGYGQTGKGFDLSFKCSSSASLVQDKNFYLLTAIQQDQAVSEILANNTVLKAIYTKQQVAIAHQLQAYKDNPAYFLHAYEFQEADLKTIAGELQHLVKEKKVLQDFVENNLRPSGRYESFKDCSNATILVKAWRLCAQGMNRIIKVYGLGEAPQYAAIDSVSYDVRSDYYKGALYMWSDFLAPKKANENSLFFQASLDFSLSLLYLNHRDEVARFEPLDKNENQKAIANLKQLNFNTFDYATILILGNGPENYQDRLSAVGKLNLALGVAEYNAKKAPLIIVSGGYAHPFRTSFCEAIEMKKELMQVYNIPEEHILIDPYARHTTTNLRNASRLMAAYQIPMNMKSLVITNRTHSSYVGDKKFGTRCIEELGYLPATILKRVNSTALTFLPAITSLQQNPIDPLDP